MAKSHTPGRDHATDTHVIKGAGLARGPALILGAVLAAAGLALFLHAGATPTGGFPDADATGSKVLGFESNGWTAFFTTTAGVVLLFAAAQHLLAKTLGLVVGLALAACVVLDLVNGPGVLGLAAANWAVDLGWAIAAGILLLNVFAPRITKKQPVTADRHDDTHRAEVRRDGDRHDGPHLPGTHRDDTHGDHGTRISDADHGEHDTRVLGDSRPEGVARGSVDNHDEQGTRVSDVVDDRPLEPGTEAPRSSTTGAAPAAGDGVSSRADSTRVDR